MTYPNGHLYVTAHWTVLGALQESGQFGLRFDSTQPASQALATAAAAPITAFWTNATALIGTFHNLSFIRVAAVGIDGKYISGTIAYDSPPAAGGGAGGGSTVYAPLQCAQVISLTTALPRGRAHRGRVYVPPVNTPLQTDYHWPASNCAARANAFAQMVTDLNAAMPGPLTVFSKVGLGTKAKVTAVAVGNRPDVQRRRARSLTETYSVAGSF